VSWAPWHRVTGSTPLLKKILAFCFVWKKSNIMHTSRKGKRKTRGREQNAFVCFKDHRLKAKEYRALISSKKKICWLIADLSAL